MTEPRKNLLPPKYLNIFLVLAVILHFLWPIKRFIPAPFNYLGVLFIILGLALNIWSTRLLREHKTALDFDTQPSALVTSGPFGVSRNPIYLSGIVFSTGFAILLGSVIVSLFPIALFVLLDRLYIPSEEEKLEDAFGARYLDYKEKVSKWL